MKILELPIVNEKLYINVNEIIGKTPAAKTFVEPFCGSTSMFLNLSHRFKKVIANDVSKDVIRIFKSLRDTTHAQLIEMRDAVMSEFGNISNNVDSMNFFVKSCEAKYGSDKMIERGLFLYIASNQNIMNEANLKAAQSRLLDTIFYSENFDMMINIYDDNDVIFFFNPPYIINKGIFDYENFIKSFGRIKGKIIYVDVYDKNTLKALKNATGKKWKHVDIDHADYKESVYYNF